MQRVQREIEILTSILTLITSRLLDDGIIELGIDSSSAIKLKTPPHVYTCPCDRWYSW